ncbi:2-hydroxychromene-2-carboxylate isomerase [Actinokineospora xionganensis]|uniref:2-hydroxychromene-2-carboxylate isomerase n=1 Tax=Actinokineospora xionganensis TaxID=2684470 RepID=A0ABR7L449_9PSEU|nr:DsbA family protein [Actinokineospora xionganensis]MBC6447463.1 DsbA family protein [Actinokineospora xionganensis]
MAKRPPRWYFSFRSPYSWLAYRDLIDTYPDVAARIEWRPFWEPEPRLHDRLEAAGGGFPYVPMSREKHHYILQDVRRLAAERGLTFSWPVDREPRWEVAHLGYLVAADRGLGREYIAQVYRARWELGLDISDPLTITSIASDLGTDPRGLADAERFPAIQERGVAALLDVSADGVFGVPFFARGFDKFWGLDRLPGFVAAMRAAAADAKASTVAEHAHAPALASAGDFGHAGGCG